MTEGQQEETRVIHHETCALVEELASHVKTALLTTGGRISGGFGL